MQRLSQMLLCTLALGFVQPAFGAPNDTDGDGIPDEIEDLNRNGVVDAGECDFRNSDTDSDGLNDLIEVGLNGRYDIGDTRCDNADTDGDGVDDGVEDSNRNGRVDAGECNPRIDDFDDYWADSDNDTYGDPGTTRTECLAPFGYVTNDEDCDDTRGSVNPGAQEVCNTLDDDCDGLVDVDDPSVSSTGTWFQDADGDGFGNPSVSQQSCVAINGYVAENSDDCDDTNSNVNPSVEEVCENSGTDIDNDCNGLIDEDDPGRDRSTGTLWYLDADGDGYGTSSTSTRDCAAPSQFVPDSTDCNDQSLAVNPGVTAAEDQASCDGVDNNCDGIGGTDHDYDGDGLTWAQEYGRNADDCSVDSDGDGVPDSAEWFGTGIDHDGDGKADIVDDDDDDDGVLTQNEDLDGDSNAANDNTDGDGSPNYLDNDDDDDGLLTKDEVEFSAQDPRNFDFDGDGIPNFLDDDDDDDMIRTLCERMNGVDWLNIDSDFDGAGDGAEWFVPSDYSALAQDTDSDGVIDGWNAVIDPYSLNCDIARDTDGDSTVDANDDDDDNDQIPTERELDFDGDGQVDNTDTPSLGACVADYSGATGTHYPNWIDTDSDGDGFDDNGFGTVPGSNGWVETLGDDNDLDGIVNMLDCNDDDGCTGDNDGDGITNCIETCPPAAEAVNVCDSADELGTNPLVADTDLDGISDGVEVGSDVTSPIDSDGDNIIDALDDDDDDDGVLTHDEGVDPDPSNPNHQDTDGDNTPDYLDNDDDGDGVLTQDELSMDCDIRSGESDDCDCDGTPNYLDADDFDGDCAGVDSDEDGIKDAVEEGICADVDGQNVCANPNNPDSDDDGIVDGNEIGADESNPQDTDGDGIPDILDKDDDDDGIPTDQERADDTDNNGVPDDLYDDDDGDGIPTIEEGNVDTDGDGIVDHLDMDSDNDGVLDGAETDGDSDGDGIPDRLDAYHDSEIREPVQPPDYCGCSAANGTGGWWALTLGIIALRRRNSAL